MQPLVTFKFFCWKNWKLKKSLLKYFSASNYILVKESF